MLYREIIAVCSQIHTNTQIHCVGRTYSVLMLKQVVHMLTTAPENVNKTFHGVKSVTFWCANSHTARNWNHYK